MVDLYRVRTVWTDAYGGPYYSNHYFNSAVGDGGGGLVEDFWGAMSNHIATSATAHFDGTVEVIDSETGQLVNAIATDPWDVQGTASGSLASRATQGLIQWRTAQFVNGRRLRGRTFIPGVLSADGASGIPGGTYITALQAGIAVLEGQGFVIYSTAHRTFGIVPVGASSAWEQFAVLRSRRT